MNQPRLRISTLVLILGLATQVGNLISLDATADVVLPNIFSSHMVLQRDQPNKIWGKAAPSENVTVSVSGGLRYGTTSSVANADANGNWTLMLPSLSVGGPYKISIHGNKSDKVVMIDDVLAGEVWICSGQSNMQWTVASSNDPDLERLASNYPQIRMINYEQRGSQEAVWSHDERVWQVCSPETLTSSTKGVGFSAVGYFFARQLHQTLGVPIGMVNNAWGGSACEAWVDRPTLEKTGRYTGLLDLWKEREKQVAELSAIAAPNEAQKKQLASLKGQLSGNANPANIYNGVLSSHIGYGIRGAIWYQGESNANRAYQYRELFPLMISTWRKVWNQGDFPFYWVQLADFQAESDTPGESAWAELREAQTMTMKVLPKTGQAVIIDIGEGKDIHPKNKVDVGRRLARWALANEYSIDIAFRSPEFKAMEIADGKARLTFDHLGAGWRPFDVREPRGFEIAGEDRKFYWATAVIDEKNGNSVVVSAPEVPSPVAVRYAWSNNPRCNMFSQNGLPLTPFRTDDWPGVTAETKQ
jgi:sialate O-acetylesterase